ncbi:ATP-dependent zinc metalloprotease FtsH [Lagierella massiliensis]|uniref:ATP-dependent zinc metalloprotease FtsH n=1 Tax=Lagierella massiliensis TaxID=1689303 RepID=UPI0006D81B21
MRRKAGSIFYYIGPLIFFLILVSLFSRGFNNSKEITVNKLINYIEDNDVKTVTRQGNSVIITTKKNEETFKTYLPDDLSENFYDDYIKEKVESGNIELQARPVQDNSKIWNTVINVLFFAFTIFIAWYLFIGQMQKGGGSNVANFGKNRAKLYKESSNVNFDDVAGLKEEKEELQEIVDFLKNPKKYIEIGARIPKGVLLVGPPGTGKTYLSKAVAGEAKVPFFSISGSDFVEMYVGVGASRVRDLFKDAKKNSPCIIFIDEIDAVGRKRGAGLGGGHDEREQTLNQLLVEMDGFGKNEGIIVMAATNRPDILDPAILRPGRFDRRVYIGIPDVREREAILKVHTKNKKLAPDVNLEDIAKSTTGFTPADLENLTNEAALLAAREDKTLITSKIFDEATIKVVAGPEKKSAVVIEKERVLTAYHEAGHAIVSRLLPDTDPVHMITIVPRGRAGGFTSFLPEEDRSYTTKNEMKHEIITLLGGRCAEHLVLNDISTGASNDIERATKVARAMITQYGMSDKLGPIMYDFDSDEVFVGKEFGKSKHYSDRVAYEIDEEMRKIIKEAFYKALKLLEDNIDLLHKLAKVLLEKETIRAEEFENIFNEYSNQKIKEEPPELLEKVQMSDKKIEDKISGDSENEI